MSKNLLSEETSEYLLQHKDNPVHWYPWDKEALKAAKEQNKPIFLSVGYAACHWCHVMAHECFEDAEVAEIMNEHFINIKIDREERPDIDKIYMTALHALGEQGGWPLSMFLSSNAEPFWGGTYFPKTPKYGRPGFASILLKVSEVYQKDPKKILQNKLALIERLQPRKTRNRPESRHIDLNQVLHKLLPLMDQKKGGPKGAPKFPQAPLLEMFWCGYQKTGNIEYKNTVITALTHISQGGIYDHLGGGFSRYSVDENWLVPHFEKMIYDNAQLINLMCKSLCDENNLLFRKRIEETIGWLVREMRDQKGAYYASLDADSEGVEGKYYVWDKEEIQEALPANLADAFVKTYGVDSHGNWEGKNILNRLESIVLQSHEKEAEFEKARNILFSIRENRIKPGLDDKILSDWNGMLISALASSSVVLDRNEYLDLAKACFGFIKEHSVLNGELAHSYAKSKPSHRAMLDDYANMIKAALSLYELIGEKEYLLSARIWLNQLNRDFWSEDFGAYFMSSDQDPLLIVRMISATDEATPGGNAVMIENLVRLYSFTGDFSLYEMAEKIIMSFKNDIANNIFAHSTYFTAEDFFHNYAEIIICTPFRQSVPNHIVRECLMLNTPHKIIHQCTESIGNKNHPAHGKKSIDNNVTIYFCQNRTCSEPVNSINELKQLI